MPELPDVEGHRRCAQQHAVGHTVEAVRCLDAQILRTTTPQGLGRALSGATIEAAHRHGKWLWLATDAASDVLVHFGMTGSFHWHGGQESACDTDLVQLILDHGTFVYTVTRKLGGIWLVHDARERQAVTGELGIDALDADAQSVETALSGSRASLKTALMDQARLAGIGNLLADELCWQTGLHPATRCADLPDPCWAELAEVLARILEAAVEVGRVPTTDGFLTGVRDEADARCPRCGAPLATDTVGGRSTRWCTTEQPDPR